jgi:voltage-gated potassium channel
MTTSELPPATPSPASITQSETAAPFGRPEGGWRLQVYTVIFESDSGAGRLFDLLLVLAILASVIVVILDSVQSLTASHEMLFDVLEWAFTLLFTVEYVLRLASVRHPLRYATSFYGIVDLLSVLPNYLVFFVPEINSLINVRLLRLLRIFRILKLSEYVSEFGFLAAAVAASRRKITVFIGFVLVTVAVFGTVMYVVEGPENGFTSIPVAIYWASPR